MEKIEIYTDGSCLGNPGNGGWGVVLIQPSLGLRKELSGSESHTTNNRMELMAAIQGLEALKAPCVVELTSDSKYLVNAMEKGWAKRWEKNGWRLSPNGKEAKNPDLWDRLLFVCSLHYVKFLWVHGHTGHIENERCDYLATTAAKEILKG